MQRNIKLLVLLAFCVSLGVGLVWAQKRKPKPKTAPPATPQVKEIAGYRAWTKVTPHPARMSRLVAAMCAAPTVNDHDTGAASDDNPHLNHYINVFVNEPGRAAMTETKKPVFPVGSVIVKEKLPSANSTAPELLTVMVKREAGYNADSGDWEYLVTDGKGEKVTEHGALASCNSCHTNVKDNDYIFRSYLPPAVKAKLR